MPEKGNTPIIGPYDGHTIIIAVVSIVIVFVLAAFFILVLVAFINSRKKKFIKEKQALQITFNEQLLKSQLEIQEQTFNNISREIHDNVGQVLSLAKIQLSILDKSETLDKSLLADAKESVGKAMSDLRDIAKSLSTERIQAISLSEMTNHELQRINRSGLMVASLQSEGIEQVINEQKKLILFRMVQESLHNILKHSNATNILVSVFFNTDNITIEIKDNGKGFEIGSLAKGEGLGLQNIVDRAVLIGGEAKISSCHGTGTTITIISPYE